MYLTITDDYEGLSRAGADFVSALITANPTASIVVATGESPMGMYRDLGARIARGELDASHLRIFQLDAYLGIGTDDPRSLYGWMDRSFLQPLRIPPANVVRLPGDTPDPDAACRAYDDAVAAAGGFDLSILGLGPNGHLGFNEPPSSPDLPTRVVDLTQESLDSNARYWGGRDRVPTRAITAGMRQLLAARQTLLLVSGARKHTIVRRAVEGPPTADVPGSLLQQAPHVTVIVDRAAWDGEAH